jgi:hypothetical protein
MIFLNQLEVKNHTHPTLASIHPRGFTNFYNSDWPGTIVIHCTAPPHNASTEPTNHWFKSATKPHVTNTPLSVLSTMFPPLSLQDLLAKCHWEREERSYESTNYHRSRCFLSYSDGLSCLTSLSMWFTRLCRQDTLTKANSVILHQQFIYCNHITKSIFGLARCFFTFLWNWLWCIRMFCVAHLVEWCIIYIQPITLRLDFCSPQIVYRILCDVSKLCPHTE